jgi:hypothetical protein
VTTKVGFELVIKRVTPLSEVSPLKRLRMFSVESASS